MRLLMILALIVFHLALNACVTYNPSTGTYTVDPQGSAEAAIEIPDGWYCE